MILCIWNSRKKAHVKDDKYITDHPESHYQKHLYDRGFRFGESGHIYVKVCKARDIDSGADNVFTFNGNTGVIDEAPLQAATDCPKRFFDEEEESTGTEKSLFNLRGY